MADKDINIKVKTLGAPEAKQQLDKTAEGVHNVGASVQGSGEKAGSASSKWSMLFSLFTGAAILAALKGIVSFFDNMMAKADQAIGKAGEVRKAYEGLFEAFGAYDEKSRKKLVKETEQLLIQTGAPAESGYPTIEKYARQFKDVMPAADYNTGLQNALTYAARHGGTATPELIDLMRGYGMNTAQQQSEFIRTVGAAATISGMADEDVISALGRAAPAARAIGMSPQEAASAIAALAAGETGRNKAAMPATVIEAMASPQTEGLKKYRIAGQTPNEILENVRKKSQGMSAQSRFKMLEGIYGAGAVKGVYKMMTAGAPTVAPVSEAADRAEQESYMQTMEAKANQAEARAREIRTQIDSGAQAAAETRKIGQATIEANAVENPTEQELLNKLFWLFPHFGQEWAAYQKWEGSLTPEQRKDVRSKMKEFRKKNPNTGPIYPFQPAEQEYWLRRMSPEEKYDALIRNPGAQSAPEPSPQSVPVPVPQNYGDTVRDWGTNPLGAASNLVQNYYNNTYINQNPPDAQPRSNGGL